MHAGRTKSHSMCSKRVRKPSIWFTPLQAVLTLLNRLADINKHCLAEFRAHWQCLEDNNHQLWQCRRQERPFNKCVFDNLVRVGARYLYLKTNQPAEAREEDSRSSRGRRTSASEREANLCEPAWCEMGQGKCTDIEIKLSE